jgi:hypothetical protein
MMHATIAEKLASFASAKTVLHGDMVLTSAKIIDSKTAIDRGSASKRIVELMVLTSSARLHVLNMIPVLEHSIVHYRLARPLA